MHATHAIDEKNVVIDAVLERVNRKLSWRLSSSEDESREKFLKKKDIKYFVFKNTMLFVKI